MGQTARLTVTFDPGAVKSWQSRTNIDTGTPALWVSALGDGRFLAQLELLVDRETHVWVKPIPPQADDVVTVVGEVLSWVSAFSKMSTLSGRLGKTGRPHPCTPSSSDSASLMSPESSSSSMCRSGSTAAAR